MALRKLISQIRSVSCKLSSKDMLVTKPDLAITPSQVQELTNKGISVSLPNAKQFLDGNALEAAKGWDVDPIFNVMQIFALCLNSKEILKAKLFVRIKLTAKNLVINVWFDWCGNWCNFPEF